MTRAEQEAFEKFKTEEYGGVVCGDDINAWSVEEAFLAGYRAGFEAQHYEVDDA